MILIEKAKAIVNQAVHFIESKMEYLRDRLGDFLGLHPVYKGLVYTEEENELVSKTAQVVSEYFPENPGEMLVTEDFESRCEAIEDMGSRLIELYGLEGVEIVITDSSSEFSDQDDATCFGYAAFSEKRIYINANCLRSDDQMILEHIVSTVIHELRHLIQYQVAKVEKTYGVPYNRRHAWRNNIVNYIDSDSDYEGYYNQPIEFDARNFTNCVWTEAYNL